MRHAAIIGILLLCPFASVTRAQAIFTYTFSDVTTASGRSSSGSETGNVTFSSFAAASTLGANSNTAGIFAFSGWPAGATGGSDTFSGSLDATKYFEFTVTPNNGYQLTFSSLTFEAGRTGAGPRQFVVRSSLDSYAANLTASGSSPVSIVGGNVFQFTDNSSTNLVSNQSVTLTSAEFANRTGGVTFRIYGYNQEGGGFFRIDNLSVSGSVSAVPEPTTYAAFAGVAVLIAGVWRRARNARR